MKVVFLLAVAFVCNSCTKADWEHSCHTVYHGTRSEGKVWQLSCRGTVLLPLIPEVRIAGRRYVYIYRDVPFQQGVWMDKTEEKVQKVEVLSDELNSNETTRGWYTSKPGTMKRGTPKQWIWIPLYDLWVSPTRANDPAVYAQNGWKYLVEVMDRTNWELRGQLYYNDAVQQAGTNAVTTPLGIFRWVRFNNTEYGWIHDSGAIGTTSQH